MPIGPEMPTQAKLQAIAERYGLALDATMLGEYGALVAGTINACRYVEQFVEQTLPVKYPRTVGQKPTTVENAKLAARRRPYDHSGLTDLTIHGPTTKVGTAMAPTTKPTPPAASAAFAASIAP